MGSTQFADEIQMAGAIEMTCVWFDTQLGLIADDSVDGFRHRQKTIDISGVAGWMTSIDACYDQRRR
jgi:hypothetical protein